MIDLSVPLRLALQDFGEDVSVNGLACRALLSTISEGQQVALVDDYNLTAEIISGAQPGELPSVSRNQKLTRADGSVWIIINRPRTENGSWKLELSRDMVTV